LPNNGRNASSTKVSVNGVVDWSAHHFSTLDGANLLSEDDLNMEKSKNATVVTFYENFHSAKYA